MGFLKKLFGNIEKANKGEISAEEIVPPFTVDLVEEADDYWRQMEENLLINAVKACWWSRGSGTCFCSYQF